MPTGAPPLTLAERLVAILNVAVGLGYLIGFPVFLAPYLDRRELANNAPLALLPLGGACLLASGILDLRGRRRAATVSSGVGCAAPGFILSLWLGGFLLYLLFFRVIGTGDLDSVSHGKRPIDGLIRSELEHPLLTVAVLSILLAWPILQFLLRHRADSTR